jgi:uncharacterized protein YkwD
MLGGALLAPPLGGSDLRQLARDLERALGTGKVEVRESAPPGHSIVSLVDAMNRERNAYGLPPLRLNRQLSLAAGDRVHHMFEYHYFAHVGPDGKQPFEWIEERGYRYRAAGENLAVGYRTANRVVGGWMSSPGHRANVLGGHFEEIGIAIADGAPMRGFGGPTVVALYASR